VGRDLDLVALVRLCRLHTGLAFLRSFAVFVGEGLRLVEQAELGRGAAPLARRAEALALEQAHVLGESADLSLVLVHRLDQRLVLDGVLLDLRLLQKHQRPQSLDRLGKGCGRRGGHDHHLTQCS